MSPQGAGPHPAYAQRDHVYICYCIAVGYDPSVLSRRSAAVGSRWFSQPTAVAIASSVALATVAYVSLRLARAPVTCALFRRREFVRRTRERHTSHLATASDRVYDLRTHRYVAIVLYPLMYRCPIVRSM